MLTFADEGGGGVYELLFLADVICEQPLISNILIENLPILLSSMWANVPL